MRTPEILAPAGSEESLLAALRCGADAVYVGGKLFSARQNAANFDLPQLQHAVELCHLYGAKLYLTVNTLIFESEFPSLVQFLQAAMEMGVNAFLVQDLGVLRLIRRMSPDVPVHASTQMTIHTPEGAHWAKQHGISRVVVSRELSREEIAAVCQTGVEVETFVHGALCMSVSGQCGLSAVIGSRSANRGRCAQACRLPFSAKGAKNVCTLSLKDLCLVPYLAELAQDGVASLKIEGRCKRPEYVAAAVTALVQARAGEEPDLDTLRAVFSRSGFTDGYYTGKRQQMFGTRQKEDVLQAKEVLPHLAQLYQKPTPQIALTMDVRVQTGEPAALTLRDADGTASPSPAKRYSLHEPRRRMPHSWNVSWESWAVRSTLWQNCTQTATAWECSRHLPGMHCAGTASPQWMQSELPPTHLIIPYSLSPCPKDRPAAQNSASSASFSRTGTGFPHSCWMSRMLRHCSCLSKRHRQRFQQMSGNESI